MSEPKLLAELTFFDVANLVVGAIIGADIYVASSFGAGYLGPSSLLVWVVAGVIAIVIALCFAQCAALLPKVGGPYAYAKEAWGSFAGFIVGWSLWLAEWVSLAVFPVAFTRYLMFFLPDLGWMYQIVVKGGFVAFLAATNIIGVKAAGRTNDVLTLVKLTPLILFSWVGLVYMVLYPVVVASNLSPFFPLGVSKFGVALVLIFWAYAGFEISTIPADEIRDPGRIIPRAIILGISIVTVFYLITNVALFGVRSWTQLAVDTAPLASATTAVLGTTSILALIGGAVVGVGALISVAGSDESGMLGTSRLGYALAVDGLFPSVFARIHPKFKTPYLAVAYTATYASIFSLRRRGIESQFRLKGGLLVPGLGVLFSLYLISQCAIPQILVGLVLLLVGVPIYVKYSPKRELADLKRVLVSRDLILERAYRQEQRFLAHLLRHIKRAYRRFAGRKQAWQG